nr:RagB/SusD family nutrient uptake outer membrane protein [uncultured Draconibacterium sp.]
MKKNIYIINLFILLTLLMSACNDFLDHEPESSISPEQYLWEESQLDAYAINLYPNMLPSHTKSGSVYTFGTFGEDAHTDNMAAKYYDTKFVPGQWKVDQSGGDWDFENIYSCNYFLNTVVPRWKAGELSGNEENVKHYIGEMYFLRAWEYFTKVQAVGDFPIVKTILPDNAEALTEASKRVPHPDVVRFIISDLDSAIMLMQPNSPDGSGNRLSQASAQLVKSRVALYEATWLKYFQNTAFVPNGPDWPGADKSYNDGYQYPAGSIDSEIQWLFQQSMEAAKTVADNYSLTPNNGVLQQSLSDASNPYFDMFGDVDMSGYNEVLLWRGYDRGLGIVHNVPVYEQYGGQGIGLTKGMVDGYLMANGLPIYDASSGYAGDDSISTVRQNRDGRLWLFLKEPGQTNILYPTDLSVIIQPTEMVPDVTSGDTEKSYSTGYAIRKGINYDAAQCGNGSGYTGSIIYRATEAYLNYIEACYELNGSLDGTAKAYWEAIRERADVDPDFEKTIAATNMSEEAKGDWGAYSAGSLVDPTLYNIRRERRCELMAEGLRMMDLRRWRAMDQLISTPYHIEGFKLWGPMQDWYGDGELIYNSANANVSSPDRSIYLRPYEIIGNELAYDGYRWAMAHYLNPIAIQHFLITSAGNDVTTSPIYQNPGWPTNANEGATY